jgi:hypothetical protein
MVPTVQRMKLLKVINRYCTAPSACKITYRSKPHKNIIPHAGKENHTIHFEKLEKCIKTQENLHVSQTSANYLNHMEKPTVLGTKC